MFDVNLHSLLHHHCELYKQSIRLFTLFSAHVM